MSRISEYELARHLTLYFAGCLENYRYKINMKLDLQRNLVRIRDYENNKRFEDAMIVQFEVPPFPGFVPEYLVKSAGSTVVQHRKDTNLHFRYVSIIRSTVGFNNQAKNNVVTLQQPAEKSLSDQLLSLTAPGIDHLFTYLQEKFLMTFTSHWRVSYFPTYLQGRLMNFVLKSQNSIINLVRDGKILNYLFTEESLPYMGVGRVLLGCLPPPPKRVWKKCLGGAWGGGCSFACYTDPGIHF